MSDTPLVVKPLLDAEDVHRVQEFAGAGVRTGAKLGALGGPIGAGVGAGYDGPITVDPTDDADG